MRPLLHQFDLRLTTTIQQWPAWVRFFMLGTTVLGQSVCTVGIGVLVIVHGWDRANQHLFVSGLVVTATICVGALTKLLFQRERPLTEYVATMRFCTFSFPSGHAVGSMLAYGLLAYLAGHVLPQPWSYSAVGFLAALILLVGVSRIYLGAHFPSDVLAGWLLGMLGLAVIILIVQPKL